MFLNNIFQGHSIDLHDLVKAIDQGISGDHRIEASLGWELLQSGGDGRIKGEQLSQLFSLFLGGRGLSVEQGSNPDLIKAHRRLKIGKTHAFGFLGSHQGSSNSHD